MIRRKRRDGLRHENFFRPYPRKRRQPSAASRFLSYSTKNPNLAPKSLWGRLGMDGQPTPMTQFHPIKIGLLCYGQIGHGYIYNVWWVVKSYVILRGIYQNRGCFGKKSLVAGYNRENNVPTMPQGHAQNAITCKNDQRPGSPPPHPLAVLSRYRCATMSP